MQDKENNKPLDLTGNLQKQEKLDQTIEELARDLEKERDKRKEERFGWILVVVILFDAYIFTLMPSATGPFVIGTFELAGLIFLAEKMGIQGAAEIFDKIASSFKGTDS